MARILLAEDDAATRDMVQRALTADGHQVVVTQDGAEALEKLRGGGGFDLLISDVQMPGVDGIELVEKGLAGNPKLRVILMSGFAGELGRADHLQGPHLPHHHQALHPRADPRRRQGRAGLAGLASGASRPRSGGCSASGPSGCRRRRDRC